MGCKENVVVLDNAAFYIAIDTRNSSDKKRLRCLPTRENFLEKKEEMKIWEKGIWAF